jgi:uncharacterized CHY-type Zn-finger protein
MTVSKDDVMIHYVPEDEDDGLTYCGMRVADVDWSAVLEVTTCPNCQPRFVFTCEAGTISFPAAFNQPRSGDDHE